MIATSALNASGGFTRPVPGVVALGGYRFKKPMTGVGRKRPALCRYGAANVSAKQGRVGALATAAWPRYPRVRSLTGTIRTSMSAIGVSLVRSTTMGTTGLPVAASTRPVTLPSEKCCRPQAPKA